MINIIIAMDKDRIIGIDGKLPWHLSDDLKHFKNLTMSGDAKVVMGRKTWDSLPIKPLPGRHNMVMTRKGSDLELLSNTDIVSFDWVINHSKANDFWIIGGAEIYKQFLPHADKLYITFIAEHFHKRNAEITYFPEFEGFKLVKTTRGNEYNNPYKYWFEEYERNLGE